MIRANIKFFQTLNIDKVSAYLQLMRFDRPIGTLLLLWPTLWALWISAPGFPDVKIFLIFCMGVVVMRAAGCVINDYADRNFDGNVSRTNSRPIPSGRVTPEEALVLFSLLIAVALVLVLMLNTMSLYVAIAAAATTIIYPFAKRFTWFPQAILGIAFSCSIPMAFVAQNRPLTELVWLIFFTNLIWIMVYDTIYAMVDREDDLKVGIRSTAILFGDADRFLIGLMQIMVLIGFVIIGTHLDYSYYYFSAIVVAGALFSWQQWLIKDRNLALCFRAFLNNNYVGLVIFIGILTEHLMM